MSSRQRQLSSKNKKGVGKPLNPFCGPTWRGIFSPCRIWGFGSAGSSRKFTLRALQCACWAAGGIAAKLPLQLKAAPMPTEFRMLQNLSLSS